MLPISDKILFDDFNVVGRVEADPAILPAFAPALLVLVLQLFEGVAWNYKFYKFIK
jgi:hypothetical protein